MNESKKIIPSIVPRQCGGWLALSPSEAPIRMGISAPTETEAREKFAISINEWIQSLNSE